MQLFKPVQIRRTTLIIIGLAAFLAGLGLARTRFYVSPAYIWLSLVLIVATVRRSRVATIICVLLFGMTLGWWRGGIYMHQLAKYRPLFSQNVTIIGQADTDSIYAKGSQLSFDLTSPKVLSPYKVNLVGKISIKGYGAPAVYRGDTVQVSGKLFQTRGSRQASIGYSSLTVMQHPTSVIESARHRFVAGMYSALPEPLASFGLGLLIGQRNTLPQNVNDQLSAVGLTHIVAVSGYNLTIILIGVAYLLKGRSKYQSTLISALLIGLFILFTGFSASIVRAAIVSALTLTAAYYGRSIRPLLLILLAAALTAGWYPIYLWSDVGWYLSFLAFFGVLMIAPLITKRVHKEKRPKFIAMVVIETLSAQVMALPLIMYIFGEVSLIALPANVLIVPLVPFAMLVSFVAALGGMFVTAVVGWFAWPARILLTYMLDVVNLFSHIPHAMSSRSLPLPKLIAVYAAVLFVAFILWAKYRPKNATISEAINKEI